MLSHPEGHHSTKGEETGETATSPADGKDSNRNLGFGSVMVLLSS